MFREISQTKKDKYYIYSLICGILKAKKWTNIIKQKQTQRRGNKLVVARGERDRGKEVLKGIKRYKLIK